MLLVLLLLLQLLHRMQAASGRCMHTTTTACARIAASQLCGSHHVRPNAAHLLLVQLLGGAQLMVGFRFVVALVAQRCRHEARDVGAQIAEKSGT